MPLLRTATRPLGAPVVLALLLALLLSLLAPVASHAAEPLADTPGWYRLPLGRFTVTALWDGTLDMPVDQVFAQPRPARIKELLAQAWLPVKSPANMPLSVNAFVVDTGQRIVMIDTGAGTSRMFGDRLGRMLANLRAAGYTPEQIDEIYITHLHTDHVGGLTVDGRAVFPNAVVRADTREAGHYLSREKMAAVPEEERGDFESAMALLAPYVQAGRFQPFDGRTELIPGVYAQPAPGHTPGHTIYVVQSKEQKLVLWGDLMHVAAVQFPHPAATVNFDHSQRQAAASRLQVYRDVAREGAWAAAAHIGFPGIGKVYGGRDGSYRWVPVNMVLGH